eukprot:ctg_1090.g338
MDDVPARSATGRGRARGAWQTRPDPGAATPPARLVVHHHEMHRPLIDGVPQRIRRGAALVHRPVHVGAYVCEIPRSLVVARRVHVRLLRGQRLQQLHELVGAAAVSLAVGLIAGHDHKVKVVQTAHQRVDGGLATFGADVGEVCQPGRLGGVAVGCLERVAHLPRRARNGVGVLVARRQAADLDVASIAGPALAQERRKAGARRGGAHIGSAILVAAAAGTRLRHRNAATVGALLGVVGDHNLASIAGEGDVHVVRIQRVVRVAAAASTVILGVKPGPLDQSVEEELRLPDKIGIKREVTFQVFPHSVIPIALCAGPHKKGVQRHREYRILALDILSVQVGAELAERVAGVAGVHRECVRQRPTSRRE